jgi:disulfide bond formation protein DsbB
MLTARQSAILICAVMFAAISGAWIFEAAGYLPCELCLMQRWAYYAVVPLTAALAMLNPPWLKRALWLVALILLASMVLGIYHSGVEWKFWAGPQACSGGSLGGGLPDLSKAVVMCDEPALRIFGISLAGFNAIISAAMAWVAMKGARS